GMGEPLHNYENVMRSLELLLSEEGANFSHRHVTVSTSGLVPNIVRFGEESQVKLAVSLNATTDEQRAKLMPVDRKWNIAALIDAVRKFPSRQGRRVTFEYVLLRDVNDSDEDAARLAALLRDLPVKVNLIPYNENPGLGFGDPGAERVAAFRKALVARGITAMVRRTAAATSPPPAANSPCKPEIREIWEIRGHNTQLRVPTGWHVELRIVSPIAK